MCNVHTLIKILNNNTKYIITLQNRHNNMLFPKPQKEIHINDTLILFISKEFVYCTLYNQHEWQIYFFKKKKHITNYNSKIRMNEQWQ